MNETNDKKILLSVGSNTGNSMEIIEHSLELLKNSLIIKNMTASSYYNTSPVGYENQNNFINAAIVAETVFSPEELLFLIKSVEYLLGRKKRERWHEREIDIDILLFGDKVINSKKLTIPHREMSNRKFVLLPANEIAPDFIHPVLKKNINTLLREYKGNETVVKVE